jgi:photosystem II stability/assembly factor-like uncharacterized protein
MKNRVATIGLVAFLAVDVGLVALALRPGSPAGPQTPSTLTPATQTTVPTGTASGSGSVSATSAPATSTPTQSSAASARAVPVQLLVSGLDRQTAWRAKAGTCSAGGASLELTTDGGRAWTARQPPAGAIARVQALAGDNTFVIGAGTNCALRQYATTDQGETWKDPTAVQNGWARSLDNPAQVVTPQDDKAEPCDGEVVVDFDRVSLTQAEALCASGDVRATDDGGTTWSDSGTASGAVAMGNYLDGDKLTTYAVRIVSGCDGLQLVRVVKGREPAAVSCLKAGSPKPGQVGMSVSADMGWIVSGSETWVADVGLKSWHQA